MSPPRTVTFGNSRSPFTLRCRASQSAPVDEIEAAQHGRNNYATTILGVILGRAETLHQAFTDAHSQTRLSGPC